MDGFGPARRSACITRNSPLASAACALVVATLASVSLARIAAGADATILGRAMVVAAPDAAESQRTVTVNARETATDLATINDPRVGGAMLAIVVAGAQPSVQSFALDAGGWTAVPQGYRYRVAKAAVGPPVRKVTITAQPGGAAAMRVVLRGDTGTEPLAVVPPAPGTEGGVALTVGSERYCVRLGGPAGGTIRSDTVTRWRIVRPLAEAGCLDPPPPPLCGNGTVEGGETCDGSASPACDSFGGDATCGAPESALACSCCYPSGTEYVDTAGGSGLCCDGNEVPVAPYTRYCGSCLPDGYHCLYGEASCCSGTCFEPPGLGIPVCGSCIASGEACGGLAEFCCSGTCGTNGLCD